MTRALIVGCGRIAGGYNELNETMVLSHVVALRRAGAQVVGCVDQDPARARRFAERWKIGEFGVDLIAMIERVAPDLVVDCTPPAGRLAIASAALAAPMVRALLIEKPLGRSASEAIALRTRIHAAGKPVIVGYQRAFDACYLEAEALVQRGGLGRLRRIVALAYGGSLANMSHLLERAIAMVGRPRDAALIGTPILEDDGDPGLSFCVGFDDDVEGTFLAVPRAGPALMEFDLIGTEGRLRILDSERRVELSRALASPDGVARPIESVVPAPMPAPDWEAIRHVVGAAQAAARDSTQHAALVDRAIEAVVVIDSLRHNGTYVRKSAA
ncbi:MAG: Gfo/Idh/MocA family oxidoreductase [Alphaproteobacteria bacterium]|nr:Gfo/Idh/MocA family oxidoreductase [Alphaproteobacteria bacterium]